MRNVYIAGIGQTPVGEHWGNSLRELSFYALEAAAKDTEQVVGGPLKAEALYAANMLAPQLSAQAHMGVLIADFAGLRGIEAATIEAAGASGGAALRQAVMAVQSGLVDTALVVGIEKMTDKVGSDVAAATATSGDSDFEFEQGATPAALAAILMQRYLHQYQVAHESFANFSIVAHANAKTNPNAMFRNALSVEAYRKAGAVAEPVTVMDAAPDCDGAAAVVVTARPTGVRVLASTQATDTLALHDRPNPLHFEAVRVSTLKALKIAGLSLDDLQFFELFDAFSIYAALALEAAGFTRPGEGWRLAAENQIARDGRIPIATFGGLKARGNPGGATGVYQAVETVLQLRQQAGDNQVPDARFGMCQALGGAAASAVTHILQAA
jgi:acetyl-CoA C-acetyltransferase